MTISTNPLISGESGVSGIFDSSGNMVGLRGPNGIIPVTGKRGDLAAPFCGTVIWDYERDGAGAVSAVSASCTTSAGSVDGVSMLKITGASAAQAQIDIDLSSAVPAFSGGLLIEMAADRSTTTSLSLLASADSGFAAYIQFGQNPSAAGNGSCLTYNTVQRYTIAAYPGGSTADPNFSPGYQGTWATTPPTYPTELNKLRLRLSNATSQIPVGYVRRVWALGKRKSRVVISIDDGYASAYRLLKPVLDTYGFKATWGIITDSIDTTSLYMTRKDLEELYAQRHELVAHGPIGGTGNIVSNYSGNVASAVADVLYHRNNLESWGLLTQAARRVYVWPQGVHQSATDSNTIREALRVEGFTLGRTASTLLNYSVVADLWPDKLVLPIIGHTQAASSGAESTNIANIVAAINIANARGTDIVLMLHAGVSSTDTSWGSNGGLNMRTTDLDTICQALNTNVLAGTQAVVTLGDLGDALTH